MALKYRVIDDEFRMKVVNFLKIYGYYNGELSKIETQKKYISGELLLTDIIKSKKDFKELKRSVRAVIDYCCENYYDEIEDIMNYFYKIECADIRNIYGGFFDK